MCILARRKKKDMEFLRSSVEFIELQVQIGIDNLNFDYSLGLYDGDVYNIVRADNPWDELACYIDYTPITCEIFVKESISKADVFLRSSSLSEVEQSEIKEVFVFL